ncbi:hypothetical protein JCM10207_001701 [Rhodosporidiobolus poonsookiae]
MPPHPPAASSDSSRRFTRADAQRVYQLAQQSSHLGHKVSEALDITEQALDQFGVQHVALSFNGGKDCTVLVHLLAAALLRRLPSLPSSSSTASSTPHPPPPPSLSIPTVYVRCPSPFPQVEAFVSLCVAWYALELEAVEGGMKQALGEYLDRRNARGADEVKAVLVGTRRGDPHGATLTPLCPTDPSWPQFMRVHPILDWSYSDVWEFLRCAELTLGADADGDDDERTGRARGLDWCELYNYGYTSLGSTHNTFPNPLLRATTSDGHFDAPPAGAGAPLGGWRPAWELEDEAAERAGRETSVAAVTSLSPSSPSRAAPTSLTTATSTTDLPTLSSDSSSSASASVSAAAAAKGDVPPDAETPVGSAAKAGAGL